MIRGVTASFKFTLPHELQYIREVSIAFWQKGYYGSFGSSSPIIKKFYPSSTLAEDNPDRTSKELIVVLTAAETKAFTDKLKLRVQLNGINDAYVDNGDNITSSYFGIEEQLFTVYPMYDDIIGGDIPEDVEITGEYIILDGDNILETTGKHIIIGGDNIVKVGDE